ncbi:MAG: PAS domain S-box protein, partial [Lachnospiraceae bacterium]|nr:PAS domain S-box protein [Lachnospiraceae bacterium]
MERNENNIFPIEDALEMIFVFDRIGKISYANTMARKKLGYENDLCGRHISDVFPNTFKADQGGFLTEYPFGNELQEMVAYRKNL